jgi:hypothetical protein
VVVVVGGGGGDHWGAVVVVVGGQGGGWGPATVQGSMLTCKVADAGGVDQSLQITIGSFISILG